MTVTASLAGPIVPETRVDIHRPGPVPYWTHGGYRFVRYEESGRTCIVRDTGGSHFDGLEHREPVEAVRREQPRKVGDRVVRQWPQHGPGTVTSMHTEARSCERCTGGRAHMIVAWDDSPGQDHDEDPADLIIYEPPTAGPLAPPAPPAEPAERPPGAASLRRDVNTGRAWLEFPSKPDALTCEALGAAGWRFSGYRKQWHHPRKYIVPPTGIAYIDEGTVDYSNERAERLAARSVASQTEAMQLFHRERQIGDMIPMGQPILVGHHSERRHRRDIAKIQDLATRGVEASKKADRLASASASSARLRERRQTDPGLVERRLKRLRQMLERMEARCLRLGDKIEDDWVRRTHLVRDEIKQNEELLAELQAEAGTPQTVNPGDVINLRGGPFLVHRVNHRTFTGWQVTGGADGWPGRVDRTKWDGQIVCRANAKLRAAVAYKSKLASRYGDAKWRQLTTEGIAEAAPCAPSSPST
jgi:hypothetical protein